MRLSSKAEYGMRAILDLALHRQEGLISIADIADRTSVPLKFLEQILLGLKSAGMVDSKRGVGGGYYLVRPPEAITVADVVYVLDGPIEPMSCVGNVHPECAQQNLCSIRSVWAETRDAVDGVLRRTSFADLALRSQRLEAESSKGAMFYI